MTVAPKEGGDTSIHYLIVDDDAESRATVVEYLRTLGYSRFSLAHDGAEAYRMLERDPSINFIISDWDMPLMNGLTLLQRVKSSPKRANLPFLVMTSPMSQEAEKVILAAENLVDGYLIKPFRSQVLREKIERIVAKASDAVTPQKQVVVIDDDPDAREMVVEYLKQMGFSNIVAFENGVQGLKYLLGHTDSVGLIVSDWEMPELTGLELLRSCKAHAELSKIPFLMVTSQSSIERMKVMQAAKANVDQYLLKPFTSEQIQKRVSQAMEKNKTAGVVAALLQEAADHIEHGRYQQAQDRFEDVLRLSAEDETALRGMGDMTTRLKGQQAALPFYKRAVEAGPHNAGNYIRLALAYEQVGMVDKAIALLQSGIKNVNFSADLHFHLGKIYLKREQRADAQREFEQTLTLELDHQEARLMLDVLRGQDKKG